MLIVAAAAALTLIASRLAYTPMWDGFVYAAEINDAAAKPFSLGALRLAGHASQVYAVVAIGAQKLEPGATWPLLVLNTLLLGIAAIGFARLLVIVFPRQDLTPERALLTTAFVLQPSMLAAVVQPGLDLPLLPAFIWCAVTLLERRTLGAIVLGLVLAFTKETGMLLYGALVASYAGWRFVQHADGFRERIMRVVALAPLVAPALVFGGYLLYRRHTALADEAVMWNAGTAMIGQSLVRQLLVPRVDRYLASYLAIVLVLNFAWAATVAIGSSVVTAGWKLMRASWSEARRRFAEACSTTPAFVVMVAIVSGYLLTRFATYANSRYLLPLMGLRDAVFLTALVLLPIGAHARRFVLGAYAVLLLVSTLRTVDPVSRALYGTFAFGDHRMLRMTSITHECCGAGRDQLVYNLEFTQLEALTNDALVSWRPDDSTLVVIPDSTNWYVADRLDRSSGRRVIAQDAVFAPMVIESDDAATHIAGAVRGVYVALPNATTRGVLDRLSTAFSIGPERRFRRSGYWLSTYELRPLAGQASRERGPTP